MHYLQTSTFLYKRKEINISNCFTYCRLSKQGVQNGEATMFQRELALWRWWWCWWLWWCLWWSVAHILWFNGHDYKDKENDVDDDVCSKGGSLVSLERVALSSPTQIMQRFSLMQKSVGQICDASSMNLQSMRLKLGKHHWESCSLQTGIAQIAIAPPLDSNGHSGHFISGPTWANAIWTSIFTA